MGLPGSDPNRGVYGISVAGELVGMGAQTLRLYELRGLLEPARTEGGTRRYSEADLARLRRIGELLATGLNLVGVGAVLGLEAENAQLRAEIEERPGPRATSGGYPKPPEPTSSSGRA